MSLNTAQIAGIAQQYGLNLAPDQLQDVQNNSQGGANSQLVIQALQALPQYQQQVQGSAQSAYQSAINTAVGGLQTQKSNLADQYGSLLSTVTGQYQPLINQTTATAGNQEAQRGISPDSALYQQQVQGALQPVYGQEAGAAQTIGAGSIADVNTLTQAIANMQAGGAGTASQLPLQYGSLSLSQQALPSEIAANTAQANQANAAATAAQYLPAASGVSFLNTSNQSILNPALQVLKQLGYNVTA